MIYSFAWNSLVPFARRRIRTVKGIEHVPENGPYILASNHISWLDPLYLGAALGRRRGFRMYFVSKTRRHGWAHILPIDPGNPRGVVAAGAAALEQGNGVGIFPEGFSNTSSVIPHVKTGAARLAYATGVPIIPVGVRGRAESTWYRSLFHLLFPIPLVRAALQKKLYDVSFGAPLVVTKNPDASHAEVNQLTDQLGHRIAELSGKRYAATA